VLKLNTWAQNVTLREKEWNIHATFLMACFIKNRENFYFSFLD
jgi:hypothetical protein